MGWSVSSLDHICIVYNLVAGLAPFSSYWMACATDLSGGVVLSNMRGPYPTSEGVSCQAQSRVCALSQDPLTSSPTDYAVWVASGGPSVLVVPGLAVATPHEWLWARLQLPPRLIGAEVLTLSLGYKFSGASSLFSAGAFLIPLQSEECKVALAACSCGGWSSCCFCDDHQAPGGLFVFRKFAPGHCQVPSLC
ncbi:uncharacterized protein LOC124665818 isoform X2 [Lolium rigidum]|uniref:uncharacterized protein LOC124665818 isoform X2 n=1 Tax=Lolium rigidum TaxID=89674 RepID=UPI001F5CDF2B|nr:uncharacterized protein LOC124665818 isoform X2 [Lolium rigidum]